VDNNNFNPNNLNIAKIRDKMVSHFSFLDELYNNCYHCNLSMGEKQAIQVFVIEGVDYWYRFITDEMKFAKNLHLEMTWSDYQNLLSWIKKIETLKNNFKDKF
jgi:hypothetical protein